jgi:subtilisin family serine protease
MAEAAHWQPGWALGGECRDLRSLVCAIESPLAVDKATANFFRGDPPGGGVGALVEYAERHPSAAITPLFGKWADGIRGHKNWALALPAAASPKHRLFGGLHHVRLAAPEDVEELRPKLHSDPAFRFVHHPTAFYPLVDRTSTAANVHGERQWALTKCGFPGVWADLEQGPDPGKIAVIDSGSAWGHPELEDVVEYVPPRSGVSDGSTHALSVAGVIAAIRGNNDHLNTAGCCSAKLRLHDVWSADGFDSLAFYRALRQAAADKLPVVNLSLGACTSDVTTDLLIRECIENDVVVVAAMGDLAMHGSPPMYPAANCNVIAVGATNQFDRRRDSSSTGCHIWISAPGEDILTLRAGNEVGKEDGTSYSTAIVSAAVWLAKRARPGLRPAEIRELLARSVAGSGKHSDTLGHGRLDMSKLASLVRPKT